MTKSDKKGKLALHWKIIIGLLFGVVWSLVVSGFFGGVYESGMTSPQSYQLTAHPDDADYWRVTIPVEFDGEELTPVKVRSTDGRRMEIERRYWQGTVQGKDSVSEFKFEGAKAFVQAKLPPGYQLENLEYFYQESVYRAMSSFTLDWIAPWGTIFIRLLKLIAIPMVLFSIIMGVLGLGDASRLGKMGLKTLGLYLITTIAAVFVGLLVVNLLVPGASVDDQQRVENRIRYELWAKATPGVQILDEMRLSEDPQYAQLTADIRKTDPSWATAEASSSLSDKMNKHGNEKGKGPLTFVVEMVPDNIFSALSNNKLMLQIIFFAIFFGITMLLLAKEKMEPVAKVVDGLSDIFVKMVDLVMRAAPFFVFALLAGTVTKMAGDDPAKVVEVFTSLFFYSIAVILGLAFMIFAAYPMVAKLFAKIGYRRFFRGIGAAQTMAFSTSSSVATLPVTIDCVENKLGVSKKITSFVLPIGATVNMDGTSLYQAVAVVFMAQLHMVDLSLGQQLTIVLTATLASIGAAAVPSAGLVLMMVVLESVGLNPAWIAIIFPVDRILDMCRTVVNVTGDATVSSVIAKSEGEIKVPESV